MFDITWFVQRLADEWSVLDILLVTFTFYWVLRLIRGTQAVQLLRGTVILVLAMALAASLLPFRAFGWLVENALPALLVAIPVIFQPELRRALERLGRTGAYLTTTREPSTADVIEQVSTASTRLSDRRHGALIVVERTTGLEEYTETGIKLDSQVTVELLLTIFYPNTALHDGAVVIRSGRIVAAACVLPLAGGTISDRQMGLRHRASIGVTEQTDAVAVVISEETGIISVAHNGRMIRRLDGKRLRQTLQALFPQPAQPTFTGLMRDMRDRVENVFGSQET
ncbi:MAG TPA: diadenylate cyclase CdaA [Anaerolineae bacterium]|nr:diadenylate cyclase CdaA [Anaerolineae bacterium]